MQKMTSLITVLTLSLATGASLRAQEPAAANPVSAAVRTSWDGAKGNVSKAAEAMPESDYGFRPVSTVRTYGQILAHVAGANYVFCAAAKGEKTPFAEDAFEKS